MAINFNRPFGSNTNNGGNAAAPANPDAAQILTQNNP